MVAEPTSPWRNRIVDAGQEAPNKLLANPKNWRTHPKAQREALAGVLDEVGWVQDVIVNRRTGLMVDGHLRVELAVERGEASVPVKYVDLDEGEEALILATLDPLAGMAGAAKDALESLLAEVSTGDVAVKGVLEDVAKGAGLNGAKEGLTDPDAVPKVAEAVAKRGDVWVCGDHRVMCGDSTDAEDVARLMAGEKATLCLTDPPYNVGLEYGSAVNDAKANTEYESFTRAWVEAWTKVSERQIVTPGCNNLASWLRWFTPYHVAPWTKTNAMTNGKVARWWCWEPILFFGKGWARERTNDVFEFAVPPQTAKGLGSLTPLHPCPKPLPMWEDLLGHYGESGIMADPFLGSGTTMIAAERLGRRCYGMEIEPRYVDVAVRRWEEFTGRKAERDGA